MFRDRRVVFGSFVMPLLVMFLMFNLFGKIGDTLRKPMVRTLAFVDHHEPNMLQEELTKNSGYKLLIVKSLAEAEKLVQEGKARLAVDCGKDFNRRVEDSKAEVEVRFDPDSEQSGLTERALSDTVSKINLTRVKDALSLRGANPAMTDGIKVSSRAAGKPEGLSGSILVTLLPYLIVLYAFQGGMSVASDMVAGEKERGTMETLLITPVNRQKIALGKLMALATICLASCLMSVLSLFLQRAIFGGGGTPGRLSSSLQLGLDSILAISGVIIPLVLFFAGLLLSVSSIARNMRESQTYLALLMFLILIPAIMSNFIGILDLNRSTWVSFTPVLNAAICIREALIAKVDLTRVIITSGMNLVIAMVTLRLAVWLFNREQILTRV